jgi:2-isopropylmalate synthase
MTTDSPDVELEAFGVELREPYFQTGQWVSAFNFLPEVRADWLVPDEVDIHDVTLRDGEQTAGIVFTPDEKIAIAIELDAAGVASIEPGLLATPEDREVTATLVSMGLRAAIKPLARVRPEDVKWVLESGAKHTVLEMGINPFLLDVVYETNPDELATRVIDHSNEAAAEGVSVEFMAWDVLRTPSLDYLHRFFDRIVDGGSISRLTLADTFGMAHPSTMAYLFRTLRSWFPDLKLGLHIHNDFGQATAGAMVALTSGASSVHCSVNGLGERAGNVATEEVAVGLQYLLGINAGMDLSRLTRLSTMVAEISKRPIAANKPIVGTELFDVESGIVIHLLERLRASALGEIGFTPFLPDMVGQRPYRFVAGRGTGRAFVQSVIDQSGIAATEEQIDEIVDAVKRLALVLKGKLPDSVLRALIDDVVRSDGAGVDPAS